MNDEYLLFGQYPQTRVNDETLIDELSKLTEKNNLGYYEYKKINYAKQVAVPDSFDADYINDEDEYEYEEDHHVYGTFNDGTKIIYGKTYWFKVEPIKWKIIDKNKDKALLLSEYLLDTSCFYDDLKNRNISKKVIYANNYEHSYIRKWLNNEFLNAAFSSSEQNDILEILINNSKNTTAFSHLTGLDNMFSSVTKDKIFLLSYKDVINEKYGFEDEDEFNALTRQAKLTDYALARGADHRHDDSNHTGCWWLRSPSGKQDCANFVDETGFIYTEGDDYFTHMVCSKSFCVRPVIVKR